MSRYEIGLNENDGKERFTAKDHHDLVVKSLPENADTVFKSGIVNGFAVFGVTGEMIFDSLNNAQNHLPSIAITKELNTRANTIEKTYESLKKHKAYIDISKDHLSSAKMQYALE